MRKVYDAPYCGGALRRFFPNGSSFFYGIHVLCFSVSFWVDKSVSFYNAPKKGYFL